MGQNHNPLRTFVTPFSVSVTLFVLFVGHNPVESANILFVQDIPWTSHFIWNFALAEGLTERGHNVTMLGPNSHFKGGDNPNYYPVIFEGVQNRIEKKYKTLHLKTLPPLKHLEKFLQYSFDVCNYTYRSKGFQKIWKSDDLKFDLIIIDLTLGQCMYPLIEKFDFPPTIGVSAHKFSPGLARLFGNDIYPAFVPHTQLTNYTQNMDFWQRLWNYVYTNLDVYINQHHKLNKLKGLAEQALKENFDFEAIEKHISLFLANYNSLLDTPQPLAPNVIPVGGMHVKTNDATMAPILKNILDNAGTGFIYFTWGANINISTSIAMKKRKAISNAFGKLERRTVVWKYDSVDVFETPENVMTHMWLPQNGVLGHPNAALLITNGGLLSLQEAAFHGIPIVAIPFTAEQRTNVKKIVDDKLGIQLEFEDLNEESLFEAMMEVLDNEEYLINAKGLARKLGGQNKYLLQQAVFYAEYSIRNKGADFLRPKSRDLSYFVASSKDVEMFILIVGCFGIVVFLLLIKMLMKCFRSSKKEENIDIKKEN